MTDRERLIAALTLALVRLAEEEREATRTRTAIVTDGEEVLTEEAAEAA